MVAFTLIHYHGTPITPHSERMKMAGKHFCVSFAHPDDLKWCLESGQSVMMDNGAFTFRNKGGFDPDAFAEWVAPHLGHPHWAVVPDVIDGTEQQQRELVSKWPHPRELSAPVWHMGLSIKWLLELSEAWPKICFGSTDRYWQVGSDDWSRRCDLAWNELEKRNLRPWVHMLRGLSIGGDRWPFASADSTNVARNFKNPGAYTCPERMARRIDSVQNPSRWHVRSDPATLDLFAIE